MTEQDIYDIKTALQRVYISEGDVLSGAALKAIEYLEHKLSTARVDTLREYLADLVFNFREAASIAEDPLEAELYNAIADAIVNK